MGTMFQALAEARHEAVNLYKTNMELVVNYHSGFLNDDELYSRHISNEEKAINHFTKLVKIYDQDTFEVYLDLLKNDLEKQFNRYQNHERRGRDQFEEQRMAEEQRRAEKRRRVQNQKAKEQKDETDMRQILGSSRSSDQLTAGETVAIAAGVIGVVGTVAALGFGFSKLVSDSKNKSKK